MDKHIGSLVMQLITVRPDHFNLERDYATSRSLVQSLHHSMKLGESMHQGSITLSKESSGMMGRRMTVEQSRGTRIHSVHGLDLVYQVYSSWIEGMPLDPRDYQLLSISYWETKGAAAFYVPVARIKLFEVEHTLPDLLFYGI